MVLLIVNFVNDLFVNGGNVQNFGYFLLHTKKQLSVIGEVFLNVVEHEGVVLVRDRQILLTDVSLKVDWLYPVEICNQRFLMPLDSLEQ